MIAHDLSVRPDTIEQGSRETLPWRFDPTALLGPGESVTLPTAVLTNLNTGADHTAGLAGAPVVQDVYITQAVTALAVRTRYLLSIGFTTVPTGRVWEMHLELFCPA